MAVFLLRRKGELVDTQKEPENNGEFGESQDRRDNYRVRRPNASRRRNKSEAGARKPGGIRQRRNKHWNW